MKDTRFEKALIYLHLSSPTLLKWPVSVVLALLGWPKSLAPLLEKGIVEVKPQQRIHKDQTLHKGNMWVISLHSF